MYRIRFFKDLRGKVSAVDSLRKLPRKALVQANARIRLLAEQGHQLRRPACDYLRDGVYELRWRDVKIQYRLLYFYSGRFLIVLSHLITKEKGIPSSEIERCIANKKLFEKDPERYSVEA